MKTARRLRGLAASAASVSVPGHVGEPESCREEPALERLRAEAVTLFGRRGLSGIPSPDGLEDIAPDKVVFLDVESTGLGTGPGTVPFLVGLAWIGASGRFVVEQRMMRCFSDEPALLDWLSGTLEEQGAAIVTYNGTTYDLPLLESRYVLHRRTPPFAGRHHLDCIFPARQLWKGTVPDGSLSTLESYVFRHARPRDLPGSMIPGVWLDFVKHGRRGRLDDVLAHNVEDLVTLCCIAAVIASAFRGERVGGARVQANLGWMWMRKRAEERALGAFERALDRDRSLLLARKGQARALKRLGRRGEEEDALRKWIRTLAEFDPEPYEALAKLLEHHKKEYQEALDIVDDARESMSRQFALGTGESVDIRGRMEHRRRRLRRRLKSRSMEPLERESDAGS